MPEWSQGPEDRPLIGPLFIWGLGVGLPSTLMLYAIACLIRQEALVLTGRELIMFSGTKALLAGFAAIAMAALVHLQCFWDARFDSSPGRAKAKLACFVLLGICIYSICFQLLTHRL